MRGPEFSSSTRPNMGWASHPSRWWKWEDSSCLAPRSAFFGRGVIRRRSLVATLDSAGQALFCIARNRDLGNLPRQRTEGEHLRCRRRGAVPLSDPDRVVRRAGGTGDWRDGRPPRPPGDRPTAPSAEPTRRRQFSLESRQETMTPVRVSGCPPRYTSRPHATSHPCRNPT